MKIEEFYTINKYKRKENKYKKLTNNTLYLLGIIYTLWNNYFFKGKRLYVEELIIYKVRGILHEGMKYNEAYTTLCYR